jgi:hypothetical protein
MLRFTYIARADAPAHRLDALVDAAVHAEGEPVAGGVDGLHQRVQPVAA